MEVIQWMKKFSVANPHEDEALSSSSSERDQEHEVGSSSWDLPSPRQASTVLAASTSGFEQEVTGWDRLSGFHQHQRQVVFIQDYEFVPKNVQIDTHTVLEFRLERSTPAHAEHCLEGKSSVENLNFTSPLLQKYNKEVWQFTPQVPGVIHLSCAIYKDMQCVITVVPALISESARVSGGENKRDVDVNFAKPTNSSNVGCLASTSYKKVAMRNGNNCSAAVSRLLVEEFAFHKSVLVIKSGGAVEFAPCGLSSPISLSCGFKHGPAHCEEFKNALIGSAPKNTYVHTFTVPGRFRVVNPHFSLMHCDIEVLSEEESLLHDLVDHHDDDASVNRAGTTASASLNLSTTAPKSMQKVEYRKIPFVHTKPGSVPHGCDSKALEQNMDKLPRPGQVSVPMRTYSRNNWMRSAIDKPDPEDLHGTRTSSVIEADKGISFSQLWGSQDSCLNSKQPLVTSSFPPLNGIGVSSSRKKMMVEDGMQTPDLVEPITVMSSGSVASDKDDSALDNMEMGKETEDTTVLSVSARRRLRRKLAQQNVKQINAKGQKEWDSSDEIFKRGENLKECRANVSRIDVSKETEETNYLISSLLDSSATFLVTPMEDKTNTSPSTSLQKSSAKTDAADVVQKTEGKGKALDPKTASILPDWGSRPHKYRAFIDPTFRSTKPVNTFEENTNVSVAITHSREVCPSPATSSEGVACLPDEEWGSRTASASRRQAAAADSNGVSSTSNCKPKEKEKKKKASKKKRLGWQMSDALSDLKTSSSSMVVLTTEELEEEQLRIALERSKQEAEILEVEVAASDADEKISRVVAVTGDVSNEEASSRILTTSSSSSSSSSSSISSYIAAQDAVDDINLELQSAINESKRMAAAEAQAKIEKTAAEMKIKEAAEARAKLERKIAEVKALAKAETGAKAAKSKSSSGEKSGSGVSEMREGAQMPDRGVDAEEEGADLTIESILEGRWRSLEALRASSSQDSLPSGKLVPIHVLSIAGVKAKRQHQPRGKYKKK